MTKKKQAKVKFALTRTEQELNTLRSIYKSFGFEYCDESKKEMDLVALVETLNECRCERDYLKEELLVVKKAVGVLRRVSDFNF